jgi:AraC-like DNA-binding protein
LARKWLTYNFDPIGSDRIVSDIKGSSHAFALICSARGTPMHIELSPAPSPYLYLMMASGSHAQVFQRGKLHDVPLGHIALMTAEEPASGAQLTEGSRMSLRLPRRLLAEMTPRLDDKVGKPVAASFELRHLLMHQVQLAQREGLKLDAPANFALAQHILDLAALCIGPDKDAAQLAARRGLAAARLDAIKADILSNIGVPHIRLSAIAARHKVSERYVQYLFETAGTSFTDFILEQRLLLAWKRLRDPSNRWRKVSDIAAAAGFADISYFNRAFRIRFGSTPTDIRAAADRSDR